jgi:hypothetical protein
MMMMMMMMMIIIIINEDQMRGHIRIMGKMRNDTDVWSGNLKG